MSRITIYMEGGGSGSTGKAALRLGMNTFLKDLRTTAKGKGWKFEIRPRGGRAEAFRAFENAIAHSPKDEVTILLVDSEGPVTAATPSEHLRNRPDDGWNFAGVPDERVHLMVQTMETWIVADPEALAAWYGRGFHANSLPRAQDLETVSKARIADALDRATERTRKGRYRKIQHAEKLLAKIDPAKVRLRCGYCDRLFAKLLAALTPA